MEGRSGHCPPMRQLLLLRHAKSSWDDPALSDHSRPLNRRGRLAAQAMRTAMEGLGLSPDVVLVSTSRRTLQTMQELEPWAETPLVEPLDSLYLANADAMLAVLRQTRETVRSLLLIGHNPGLHELALLLADEAGLAQAPRLREGYPSGALAEFSLPGPWQHLDAGAARLVRFVCPRDLPEAA